MGIELNLRMAAGVDAGRWVSNGRNGTGASIGAGASIGIGIGG